MLWHGFPVPADDALDRLYGLPLAEFTPARDQLARELRKAGQSAAADEAKALAKPSISAWTVNQLARTEPMQIRGLMTAGERLRNAQAGLLLGDDPDELQAALKRQRDVVAALLESAKKILARASHPASPATLDRIRGTLTAAAVDEEGARLVEIGRLTKDLEPAGFGGLAPAPGKVSGKRLRAPRSNDARTTRRRSSASTRPSGSSRTSAPRWPSRRLWSAARRARPGKRRPSSNGWPHGSRRRKTSSPAPAPEEPAVLFLPGCLRVVVDANHANRDSVGISPLPLITFRPAPSVVATSAWFDIWRQT